MIHYLKGDATQPIGDGKRVILHCCNNAGGWGSGFVVAISKRWPEPEREYRKWHRSGDGFDLGEVQMVLVEPDLWVANMIGQRGYGPAKMDAGYPYIRYDAFKEGFHKVAGFCAVSGATVHMPRIGCGLAGGTWDKVEPLIYDTFVASNVGVYVYDF